MLKGYRTVIFNVALVVASLTEIIGLVDLLNPGATPYLILAIAIANIVLRVITTTPVFEADPVV